MKLKSKLLLGLLTLIPIPGMWYMSSYIDKFRAETHPVPHTVADLFPREFVIISGTMAAWVLLGFGLMAYYLVHIVRDPRMRTSSKVAWAIVVTFGNYVGMAVYWVFRILRAHDSRSLPTGSPAS